MLDAHSWDWVSAFNPLASVVAIAVSAWAALTARRSLQLHAARDARELAEYRAVIRSGRRGRLCALLDKPNGPGSHTYLVVRNDGQGEARRIRLMVNGEDPATSEAVLDAREDYGVLGPGAELTIRVFVPGLGGRPVWSTELFWQDDSGEPGHWQADLTPY